MSPTDLPANTPKVDMRIAALRRFALAITLFNVVGHAWLGFEQSIAQPLVALVVAYGLELLLESLEARSQGRDRRFAGGGVALANFLLPAHITGLAVSMLLYANDRLAPIVFATTAAIASKYLLRATVKGRPRHFFNPSNFGITATLVCFPWVGIAPPYMFTENLDGWGDWILPVAIVCSGSFLNARFTRRMPLIAAWLGGFALQAVARAAWFETPFTAGLAPMTGVAFVLFTFYMVTDPGTTPFPARAQIGFGLAIAATYGLLMASHVVFGLFFALTLVCTARGIGLWAREALAVRGARAPAAVTKAGRLRI